MQLYRSLWAGNRWANALFLISQIHPERTPPAVLTMLSEPHLSFLRTLSTLSPCQLSFSRQFSSALARSGTSATRAANDIIVEAYEGVTTPVATP
ncbi:hypothetical protein BCR39DRAFT_370764 [Naematelia encephala]|uniref:Uncharacterized protein n=1 Tax=Naematelia encephala TaxID=71784 RepID=A0A1Y2AJZ5_9TREE|nr:hypothetical protein BCR39DRAFT_370764 [Naematelia encephala]